MWRVSTSRSALLGQKTCCDSLVHGQAAHLNIEIKTGIRCRTKFKDAAGGVAQVPFAAGASMVAWHPKFSATVLIASSGGQFTLADTTSHGFSPTHQARACIDGPGYCVCRKTVQVTTRVLTNAYMCIGATCAQCTPDSEPELDWWMTVPGGTQRKDHDGGRS